MENLKNMKNTLMASAQGQMGKLDKVNAKELGEVIDMIKDLEEAMYYCTVTEAMKQQYPKDQKEYYSEQPYRMYYPMDSYYPPIQYYGGGPGQGTQGANVGSYSGTSAHYSQMMNYPEREYPMIMDMRDNREGRSPMSRRTYIESKQMHRDPNAQMKELERYAQELTQDIIEMIEDATPEEKQMLQQKINMLANKIK